MKRTRVKHILVFLLLFCSAAGLSGQSVRVSQPPGEYSQSILLSIEGGEDVPVYYRFSGSTADHFVPYRFPLRLSALSGEERSYRIEVADRAVPDGNENLEVFDYRIDKRIPEKPVPVPDEGFYSGAVKISFEDQKDAIFYSIDHNISDSPKSWNGEEIILRERNEPYRLYAYARDTAGNFSSLGEWEYVISPTRAVSEHSFEILSPAEGTFRNKQFLYVHSSSLSEYVYSTDGSDPRGSGKSFSGTTMLNDKGDIVLSVAGKLPDGRYTAVRTRRFSVRGDGEFTGIPESGVYREEKVIDFSDKQVFYTFEERTPTEDDPLAEKRLTLVPLSGGLHSYALRFIPRGSEEAGGHYRYFYCFDARKPEAPMINVSGTAPYSRAPVISILDQDQNRIHYSLDGSDPDVGSPLYTGPFGPSFSGTEGNLMIKARAVAEGGISGPVSGRLIPYDLIPPSSPEVTVEAQGKDGMLMIAVQTAEDTVVVFETGADEASTPEISDKSPRWTGEKLSVPWGMSLRRFIRFASRDSAGNLSSPVTLWTEINRLPPPAPSITVENGEILLTGSGTLYYSLGSQESTNKGEDNFIPYEDPPALAGWAEKLTVYTIRAFAEDEWGNRSEVAGYDYTVDRRLPELPAITGLEDRRVYNSRILTPRFDSDEDDLDVVYSLGTNSQEPPDPDIGSPSLKNLSIETEEGSEVYYQLKLLPIFPLRGRAGRITAFRFVVDRKAPEIPEISGLPSSEITNRDFVLSLGRLPEDETAYLFISDDPDSSAGSDPLIHGEKYTGPRRISLEAGLEKTIQIKLCLVDSAGNRSDLKPDLQVRIDRKAPVEPECIGLPESGTSGHPVKLELLAPGNAGVEYRLLTDENIPQEDEVPFSVYTGPVELSGEAGKLTVFQLEYRSFDEAGNRSDSTLRELITVDRRPLAGMEDPLVNYPDSGESAQISWNVPAGSTLFYRIAGDPEWSVYTAPFSIKTPSGHQEIPVQYYLQSETGLSSSVVSFLFETSPGAGGESMVRGAESGAVYPGEITLEPALSSGEGIIRYELGVNTEAPKLGPYSPLMEDSLVLNVPVGMERRFSLRVGFYPLRESRVPQSEESLEFTIDRTAPRPPRLIEGFSSDADSHEKLIELDGGGNRILYSLDGGEAQREYTGIIRLDTRGAAGRSALVRAVAVDKVGNRSRTAEWTVLLDQDIVYVSERGNDLYEGSRNRPFRSLAKALEMAQTLNRGTLYIAEGSYEVQRPLVISSRIELIGGLNPENWEEAGRSTIQTGKFFPEGGEMLSIRSDCRIQGLLFKDSRGKMVLPLAVRNASASLKDIDTAAGSVFEYLLSQEGGVVSLTDSAVYRGGRRGIFLNQAGSLNIEDSTLTVTDEPSGEWSAVNLKGGSLNLVSTTIRPGHGTRTAAVTGEDAYISLREAELYSGSGSRSAIALKLEGGQAQISGGSIHADEAQTPIALRAEGSRLDIRQLRIILGGRNGNTGLFLADSEMTMRNCDVSTGDPAGFSFMLRQREGTSEILNCTASVAARGEPVLMDIEGGRLNMLHSTLLVSSSREHPSGIISRGGARLFLTNSIISNTGGSSGTALKGGKNDAWSIRNCNFGDWSITAEYGGRPVADPEALNSLDGDPLGGWIDGNIGEAPGDSFSNGDYRLREASACVNAGTGSGTVIRDMDGQERPNPGHGIKPIPDIGADEFYAAPR